MRKNILLVASGLVAVILIAVLAPFYLAVSDDVLIRASVFDVAPQVTDTANWSGWNVGARELVVVEKGPSAVVVRCRGMMQSLEVVPDAGFSHVRWKSRVLLRDWLSWRFRTGAALGRLKKLMEDPAGYYGFTITIHPVTDTLMLSRKVMVLPAEVAGRRVALYRSLRDYLGAHSGVRGADYFFVGVDPSLKKDSVVLSVGIPVSGSGPLVTGVSYLRLPAAGRLLEGTFSGSYSRMVQLRSVMEQYIRDQRLVKVADPFEKWSGVDTARGTFSLVYGIY